MAVSTRSAVAIHALTYLARWDPQLRSSAQIAESLESNPVAVRRILGLLRDRDLVVATEGAGGGWRLARSARRITLADAYAAVEDGAVLPVHPHPPNRSCVIGRHMQVLLEEEFDEAERALAERLARTTIATMLDRVLGRESAPGA